MMLSVVSGCFCCVRWWCFVCCGGGLFGGSVFVLCDGWWCVAGAVCVVCVWTVCLCAVFLECVCVYGVCVFWRCVCVLCLCVFCLCVCVTGLWC